MERGEIAFRFRANDGINCMLAWQIYVLQGMLRNTIAFICDFPGGGGGGSGFPVPSVHNVYPWRYQSCFVPRHWNIKSVCLLKQLGKLVQLCMTSYHEKILYIRK